MKDRWLTVRGSCVDRNLWIGYAKPRSKETYAFMKKRTGLLRCLSVNVISLSITYKTHWGKLDDLTNHGEQIK